MGAVVPSLLDIGSDYLAKKIGASFINYYNSVANTYTALTPAANTTGVIVRSGYLFSDGAGSVAFAADTAAPTNPTDSTKRWLMYCFSGNLMLPQPLYVPAGIGLYFTCNTAGNRGFLTWDALP